MFDDQFLATSPLPLIEYFNQKNASLLALPGPILLIATGIYTLSELREATENFFKEVDKMIADSKHPVGLAIVSVAATHSRPIDDVDDQREPEDPRRPSRLLAPSFSIWHMPREDSDAGAIIPTQITVAPITETVIP